MWQTLGVLTAQCRRGSGRSIGGSRSGLWPAPRLFLLAILPSGTPEMRSNRAGAHKVEVPGLETEITLRTKHVSIGKKCSKIAIFRLRSTNLTHETRVDRQKLTQNYDF